MENVSELIRIGEVTSHDEKTHRVRVTFYDTVTNASTSQFLQVLVPRAYKDCYYDLPDIGSKVLCLFLPNGNEVGFVIGSFYPQEKSPKLNNNIYKHSFADGTYIEYDRSSHVLTASCVGDVNLSAKGTLNLRAENVNLVANSLLNIQAKQVQTQE